MKLLLDQNDTLVDKKHKGGWTPLQRACHKGHLDIVALLLGKAADVNAQTKGGFSPLFVAVEKNHTRVVELLLDRNDTLVDVKLTNGWTPLLQASHLGFRDIAALLLKKGADVNAQGSQGFGPLLVAVGNRHAATARLLLDQDGVRVDLNNTGGWTSLMKACKTGQLELARLLLGKGANVNARNGKGFGSLFVAVEKNRSDVVRLLLEQDGIEVDARQESHGYTPLHKAAEDGNVVLIKLLVEKGRANTGLKNKKGETPLQVAERGKRDKAVQLLKSLG